MSEWWTYRLSNLLLFSPRTYYRLFELYNAAIWPAPIVAVLAGVALLYCLLRPTAARGRIAAGILAASWGWVAIAFLAKRYATINFAAVQFAWGFGVEAAVLVWAGVIRGFLGVPRKGDDGAGGAYRASSPAISGRGTRHAAGPPPQTPSPTTRWKDPGAWMLFYSLFLHPLAGPAVGREWKGIEVFGIAPDPTAIATLGAVLAAAGRSRWHLLVIPTLWCAVSGATLLAMKDPRCWILFLAAALALVAAFRKRSTVSPASPASPSRAG